VDLDDFGETIKTLGIFIRNYDVGSLEESSIGEKELWRLLANE